MLSTGWSRLRAKVSFQGSRSRGTSTPRARTFPPKMRSIILTTGLGLSNLMPLYSRVIKAVFLKLVLVLAVPKVLIASFFWNLRNFATEGEHGIKSLHLQEIYQHDSGCFVDLFPVESYRGFKKLEQSILTTKDPIAKAIGSLLTTSTTRQKELKRLTNLPTYKVPTCVGTTNCKCQDRKRATRVSAHFN